MTTRDPFAAVPQVSAVSVFDSIKAGKTNIVDVREASEWDLGHIEGSVWIPLGQLPYRWKELTAGEPWICVCRRGNRSNYAASLLRQAGVDASNMKGGMLDWQARRLPITAPGIVEEH